MTIQLDDIPLFPEWLTGHRPDGKRFDYTRLEDCIYRMTIINFTQDRDNWGVFLDQMPEQAEVTDQFTEEWRQLQAWVFLSLEVSAETFARVKANLEGELVLLAL